MTREPDRVDQAAGIDRRTYLRIAGGAAIVGGMAGCLGGAEAKEVQYGYGGDPIALEAGSLEDSTSVNLTAESESNDACQNPNPVATDTQITGTLEPAGVDWYSFDVDAGTTFDVVFDRVPTTGITGVLVHGPECDFLQLRQVGTDQQVRVSATTETAGTHFVEVTDLHDSDGDYQFEVDTDGTLDDPTQTTTTQATTTVEDDFGEAGYGEAGYGGTA